MNFSRSVLSSSIALAALASLAACSGSDAPSQETAAQEAAPPAAGDLIDKLTPEYLAGEWCHVRTEFPDEKAEENRTYDFAADGTLKYQNNVSGPVDKPGTYEKKDGALVIKPTLQFIPLKPVEIEQDSMVLTSMGGNTIWTRGPCGK